ncbi:CoA transferase [Actinoplanes aureus]|uniref:CoA transferase n=1 Tax=Actinoplanes aureus TaxID=2792083 RepID=A0A931G2F4_9ACTN|nr:CoA transferase [Actinoplanes aureus]MBG0566086.1 CoA transferase [Actinoplanes aureus]
MDAGTICATHLERLGVRADGRIAIRFEPPAGAEPEGVAQARSGLMTVHGREHGAPRRLGVDAGAMAGGILAAQGALAGLIGRLRGLPVRGVTVRGLAGPLQFVRHHLAIATGGGSFPYRAAGVPAPPFRTADGVWAEIEVLAGDDWAAFWRRLGLDGADVVGAAWLPYVYRYLAGECRVPPQLPAAFGRHTLAEVRAAAEACGAAVVPVRTTPAPVIAEPWTVEPHHATTGHRPSPGPSTPDAPLSGLHVVEVTSRLQGPLAGLLLHRLGARVTKVEPPGGDFGRHSPPLAGQHGAAYLAYNDGKRIEEIDYKRPAGLARLRELAASADVFLHNWRPGRAEALGLDAAAVARVNPAVVHATASGWDGITDPPCPIAGDFVVQAYAGSGSLLNPPGADPLPSRVTLVDVTGGLLAGEAVLAGLLRRELTGHGCRVGSSLIRASAALAAAASAPWGPWDGPVETASGRLVVAAADPAAAGRLRAACGLPVSAGDAEVRAALRRDSAAHWAHRLPEHGVPSAAVPADLTGLADDPHLAGLLERAGDACWIPGTPWSFDG